MSPPAPNRLSAPRLVRTHRWVATLRPSGTFAVRLPGLSKELARGIEANVALMKPVLSNCVRFGSQLDDTPFGTSVVVLICASEQSGFVGFAARGPKTLMYRSALPSGDFGEPSGFTVEV